jgi:hypothetical protein
MGHSKPLLAYVVDAPYMPDNAAIDGCSYGLFALLPDTWRDDVVHRALSSRRRERRLRSGATLLLLAVVPDDVGATTLLLEAGADDNVDPVGGGAAATTSRCRPPLTAAKQQWCAGSFARSASVHAQSRRATERRCTPPLAAAAKVGVTVEQLLAFSADANALPPPFPPRQAQYGTALQAAGACGRRHGGGGGHVAASERRSSSGDARRSVSQTVALYGSNAPKRRNMWATYRSGWQERVLAQVGRLPLCISSFCCN